MNKHFLKEAHKLKHFGEDSVKNCLMFAVVLILSVVFVIIRKIF